MSLFAVLSYPKLISEYHAKIHAEYIDVIFMYFVRHCTKTWGLFSVIYMIHMRIQHKF